MAVAQKLFRQCGCLVESPTEEYCCRSINDDSLIDQLMNGESINKDTYAGLIWLAEKAQIEYVFSEL